MNIETLILGNLINNEQYARKTLPFLRSEYFHNHNDRVLFELIDAYVNRYNAIPTKEAIVIDLGNRDNITDEQYKQICQMITDIPNQSDHLSQVDWLVDQTEKFCQDKAIYNAIMQSIKILDDKTGRLAKGAIPQLLSDALAVSFDTSIGHDFLEDADARFEFYHRKEERIPFDIDLLNKITRGGLPRKTLNILLAGCVHPETNVNIRFTNNEQLTTQNTTTQWVTKTTAIKEIEQLLIDGYHVQVTSPDGWVSVSDFVDKGMWQEYVVTTDNGYTIRCNENHLFKTFNGWMTSQQIFEIQEYISHNFSVITEKGPSKAVVEKTSNIIPIVDITVDHDNHRYYTNGVESHNTGVGKTLAMCHFASSFLAMGKNVLYITLEMAEERIAERIDANLLDVPLDELAILPYQSYRKKIERLKSKTPGRLVIKEYPTSTASAANFRYLLNELKIKRNFIPQVIFIDYLNICASSRLKQSSNVNSYTYIKAIAEELRGLAIEFNVPIISATQTTRGGYDNSDIGLTDTSESFGLPATADFMVALIATDELKALNQFMVKQLKNRYADPELCRRFVIGVDRSRMRLYDVEYTAQDDIVDDSPIYDTASSGDYIDRKTDQVFDKLKFHEFK